MLSKTQGIVLQTIKHSDTGIIAHILTEKYGLMSIILRGIYSKKGGHIVAYIKPLQILSLELYYRNNKNLQSVKELAPARAQTKVPHDLKRNAITFFIAELLNKTLNECEPDKKVYSYVCDSIEHLDTDNNINNFHVGFVIGLTRYIGIAPSSSYSNTCTYFDMQNGGFVSAPPRHGYYMEPNFSKLLNEFYYKPMELWATIPLSGNIRSQFLDIILTYYSMHLVGLRKIKSLEVLGDVFRK